MPSIKDKRVSPIRTICEVHREIYDILESNDINPKLKKVLIEKLETAYQMGKKMDAKLRQYYYNYDDGWWKKEKTKITEEKLRRRKNR